MSVKGVASAKRNLVIVGITGSIGIITAICQYYIKLLLIGKRGVARYQWWALDYVQVSYQP